MLILICRTGNRLGYLPGVCRISSYTYVMNGAFEDDWKPAGLRVEYCSSCRNVETPLYSKID